MHHTIIVPLDGSKLAEVALPWATLLARTQQTSITLVRSVHFPMFSGAEDGYITPEAYDQAFAADRDAAQRYLDEVGRRLTSDGVDTHVLVRTGTPFAAIHDLADELGAGSIVMASHGRGGIARLVVGSIAEGVLQEATVPVMLVHASTDQPAAEPALRRILVPLDGSTLAARGLEFAQSLLPRESTLILVRVIEPVTRIVPVTVSTLGGEDPPTQGAMIQATAYLNALATNLQYAGFTVESQVLQGVPREEILSAMRDYQVDLAIMTTHGRSGVERWRLGSVAEQVARHANRPVLLVSARTLAAQVAGPYTVADLMTRDPATVRPDESLAVVARKLLRRRVSGAPVVNARGDLVGVISEHDLLTWHVNTVASLSHDNIDPSEYGRRFATDFVEQVMSRPAVSVDEGTSLIAAVDIFLERRLRRLPVTRDGKLVGIISRADVLRAMAQADESGHGILAGYPPPSLEMIAVTSASTM